MSASENIKKIVENYQDIRKGMMEKCRNLVGDAFRELLEKHPVVQKIMWTQYTPYFNDGDECVFSVHEPEINDLRSWQIGESESQALKTAADEAEKLINMLPEDLLQDVFGDHVQVTVTRDGITVDGYNHD